MPSPVAKTAPAAAPVAAAWSDPVSTAINAPRWPTVVVLASAHVAASNRQGVAAASPHANTDAPAESSSLTKMGRRRVASASGVGRTAESAVEPRGAARASLAEIACCTCVGEAMTALR